jgi:hypothetical protein
VKGEKMWVTKIECKPEGVVFDLFTDAIADVRYKASLKFEFPKGITLTTDQVEKLVAEVFTVQPAENAAPATDQQQPAQAAAPAAPPGRPAARQPAPAAVEAPPAPIEAPPPPIDAPPPPPADPKTVKLGETKDAVIADFGQPKTIAKASATKEIYVYPDFKVTFTNGKVTDIQ